MNAEERAFIRLGFEEARRSPRAAFLVSASVVVLSGLFFGAWLVYLPVMALVVAPITILTSAVSGGAPSPAVNSAVAVVVAGGFAATTVGAALRVLLRRARARAPRAVPAGRG